MILFVIIIISVLFLAIAIGVPLSMHIARRSAAPFFPSPKSVLRRAMQEVALKPDERFYDLGAGTGTSIILADKAFGAVSIGSEINILPYCIARIKIFFTRSSAVMKFESLYDQNISDADVVFCFLTERTMKKLEAKLLRELRPGTRVVCYTFPPPNMVPERTITIHGEWKLFVYKI